MHSSTFGPYPTSISSILGCAAACDRWKERFEPLLASITSCKTTSLPLPPLYALLNFIEPHSLHTGVETDQVTVPQTASGLIGSQGSNSRHAMSWAFPSFFILQKSRVQGVKRRGWKRQVVGAHHMESQSDATNRAGK
jgi:hypothetical protein